MFQKLWAFLAGPSKLEAVTNDLARFNRQMRAKNLLCDAIEKFDAWEDAHPVFYAEHLATRRVLIFNLINAYKCAVEVNLVEKNNKFAAMLRRSWRKCLNETLLPGPAHESRALLIRAGLPAGYRGACQQCLVWFKQMIQTGEKDALSNLVVYHG